MHKVLLLVCILFYVEKISAQTYTLHAEEVPIELVKVSASLRDIPSTPINWTGKRVMRDNPSLEHSHKHPKVNPNALPKGVDPALQKDYSGTRDLSISILDTLVGLSANVDPSDNCMAVGPNHVMQMTNNSNSTLIRIWNKSGDILINSMLVQDITGMSDFGDPNIIYDAVSDRFAFLVLSGSGNKLITCVSKTSDPTGAWYVYSFTTAGGFPDYPKLAVWDNSYFITTNSNDPSVFALNRSAMLAGQALGSAQKFTFSNLPTVGFESASPVTFTGFITPDPGAPALIMRVTDDAWGGSIDSDHLEIFEMSIDWVDASNSTLTGPKKLGILPYNSDLCGFNTENCVPQPGTSKKLDPLSNIVMDKIQYRKFSDHESIVLTHVCNVNPDGGDDLAGMRWYEVRKSNGNDWHVYQQGTYAPPDGYFRWMGSISINDENTIALGYNVSGAETVFPSGKITGRNNCDAKGIMSADETWTGIGASKNSVNRYGDYNGMVCDPVDGSFWFTVQYNPESSWSTRVTHFSIKGCGVATGMESVPEIMADMKIVPVPANDKVEVVISYNYTDDALLQVVDAAGKVVMEKALVLIKGDNKSVLDVESLSNGFYFLQVKTNDNILSRKLVVQH